MGEAHLHHSRDRSEASSDVLCWLVQVCAVATIGRTEIEAVFCDRRTQPLHYIQVRVEFYLTRAVKEYKAVLGKIIQLIYQPVNVFDEVLHAVDEATVGPPVLKLLYVLQRDQITNVDIALVLEDLSCRV